MGWKWLLGGARDGSIGGRCGMKRKFPEAFPVRDLRVINVFFGAQIVLKYKQGTPCKICDFPLHWEALGMLLDI